MSGYLIKKLRQLSPYVPGEQPADLGGLTKLNTNESPFPPSKKVLEALSFEQCSKLNLYSDPSARALVNAIARYCGAEPENVIAGNGSDELLAFCFQAFCDRDMPPVFADITYGFYKVYAQINGLDKKIIPLDERLRLRKEDYYNAGGTVFIANPNAPTGSALNVTEIEQIVKNNPSNLVVIDEAYIDFGGESAIPLTKKYDNLLVIQTFSKSRCLAGARIGFAVGSGALIDDLNRIKFSFNPYNLNRLSIIAGKAAIEDSEYFENCRSEIIKNRSYTVRALEERGFSCTESQANFIFAMPGFIGGEEYYKRLKEKKVLVRHFDSERIRGYVRITIGSAEQMRVLIEKTDEIMEEMK